MSYEEVTTELLRKVNEISDNMHTVKTTVAILSTQISEREKREVDIRASQEASIKDIKDTQVLQGNRIGVLEENKNKAYGIIALISCIPSIIAAICAIIAVKH